MKRILGYMTLVASIAIVPACSGGGGDDDDDDGYIADFTESEPNDSDFDADGIGAAVTFTGQCETSNDGLDYFSVALSAGVFQVSLEWSEGSDENDLNLAILSDTTGSLDINSDSAPGDSPAQVSATLAAAETIFIEVDCWITENPVHYLGTVTRP